MAALPTFILGERANEVEILNWTIHSYGQKRKRRITRQRARNHPIFIYVEHIDNNTRILCGHEPGYDRHGNRVPSIKKFIHEDGFASQILKEFFKVPDNVILNINV